MTTSWGAPAQGRWEAPLTAALLTAAMADGDQAAQDAIWKDLDRDGRAGLVWSLGAQCRYSLWNVARLSDPVRREQLIDLLSMLIGECEHVRDFAVAAFAAADIAMEAPGCAACMRRAAEAMCEVQLRAADAMGWPRRHIAAVCRRLAAL
jgi:hypothetical protein